MSVKKPVDFRATHNLTAGYAFRGNRRKYDESEMENHNKLILHGHPEQEIIAGKGAKTAEGVKGKYEKVKEDVKSKISWEKKRNRIGIVDASDSNIMNTQNKINDINITEGDVRMGDDDDDDDEAVENAFELRMENVAEADTKRKPVLVKTGKNLSKRGASLKVKKASVKK